MCNPRKMLYLRTMSSQHWLWDLVHVIDKYCQHYKTVGKVTLITRKYKILVKMREWWGNKISRNGIPCVPQTRNKFCYRLLLSPTFLKHVFLKHSFFKMLGFTEESSFFCYSIFQSIICNLLIKIHSQFSQTITLVNDDIPGLELHGMRT